MGRRQRYAGALPTAPAYTRQQTAVFGAGVTIRTLLRYANVRWRRGIAHRPALDPWKPVPSGRETMRLPLFCGTVIVAACAVLSSLGATGSDKAPPPPDGHVGSEVCATCHQDQGHALAGTKHGKNSVGNWDGAGGDEAWHGPG